MPNSIKLELIDGTTLFYELHKENDEGSLESIIFDKENGEIRLLLAKNNKRTVKNFIISNLISYEYPQNPISPQKFAMGSKKRGSI